MPKMHKIDLLIEAVTGFSLVLSFNIYSVIIVASIIFDFSIKAVDGLFLYMIFILLVVTIYNYIYFFNKKNMRKLFKEFQNVPKGTLKDVFLYIIGSALAVALSVVIKFEIFDKL